MRETPFEFYNNYVDVTTYFDSWFFKVPLSGGTEFPNQRPVMMSIIQQRISTSTVKSTCILKLSRSQTQMTLPKTSWKRWESVSISQAMDQKTRTPNTGKL